MLTKYLKFDAPVITMDGVRLSLEKPIGLLGLTLYHKLTFQEHVTTVCRKAVNIYKQLAFAARVS